MAAINASEKLLNDLWVARIDWGDGVAYLGVEWKQPPFNFKHVPSTSFIFICALLLPVLSIANNSTTILWLGLPWSRWWMWVKLVEQFEWFGYFASVQQMDSDLMDSASVVACQSDSSIRWASDKHCPLSHQPRTLQSTRLAGHSFQFGKFLIRRHQLMFRCICMQHLLITTEMAAMHQSTSLMTISNAKTKNTKTQIRANLGFARERTANNEFIRI